MTLMLVHRRATHEDVRAIVTLLMEDTLSQQREHLGATLDQRYSDAFDRIDADPFQYLMVVERDKEIVGTCHLTLIPSLTFLGSTRMNIEAVHVAGRHTSKGIGMWMMQKAADWGYSKGASIMQLTTNKKRKRAKVFYERLGFEATHEGMKLYARK